MSDRTVPAYGRGQVIQGFIQQASQKFDPDILAAMDTRDNALLEDEIVHGAQSRAFVYSIPIAGSKKAEGITVIGARQLASVYGGIQATVIATLTKRGSMFISRSFPYGGFPGRLDVQKIADLEEEEDFYEVMIEVHDIKTGNKIPANRKEYRFEKRSAEALSKNPTLDPMFERPHIEQIAFSKAYRNGVTSLIPQDAVLQFKIKNLALNADASFVGSVIEEKRSGVLRYAAARAIGVDRDMLEKLTFEQISGLADAAREGSLDGFVASAQSLGIVVGGDEERATLRRLPTAPKQVSNGQQQASGQQKPDTKTSAPKQQDGKAAPNTNAPTADEKKAEPAKQETQKPAERLAFDVMGDEVLGPDGFAYRFDSPGAFALWYRDAFEESADREALARNNAVALAEAQRDPTAKVILEVIEAPSDDGGSNEVEMQDSKEDDGPPPLEPVPLMMLPDGKPNWNAYLTAVSNDLSTIETSHDLEDWIARNESTYKSSRLAGSRTAFTGRIEPLIAGKMQTLSAAPAGPPVDKDMNYAIGLIGDLDKVKTQGELDALAGNGAIMSFVRKMDKDRLDITRLLRAANEAASARVKAQPLPEQTGEPEGGGRDVEG